jgi:hypothetical protein
MATRAERPVAVGVATAVDEFALVPPSLMPASAAATTRSGPGADGDSRMQTRVDHDEGPVAVIIQTAWRGARARADHGRSARAGGQLPRAEHDRAVLDRAPQLVEVGAGQGVFQNAMPALERLGLRDAVAGGVRVEASC